ncbi:MAG: hypothetical protein ACOYVF_00320, partial [Candidatus Zixiibacteriota bacterium]
MKKQLVLTLVAIMTVALTAGVFAAEQKSYDLNWYGSFKLDGSFDQNLTSHGNFVMWVNQKSYDADDQQFNMTANQTRFGVQLNNKQNDNVSVTGQLEFDLYASVTNATIAENKAMLQLRHAYFSVNANNWQLIAGQTWDLLSPLNPATLNYPVLWGCGNIGYRRPQITLKYNLRPSENTSMSMAGGFFRTIGSDLTPSFSLATGETNDAADDGTDAAIPSFQGQLDVNHKFESGASLRFGVSGLWGQMKSETSLGNSETYESWAVNGHLMMNLSKRLGLSGEAYTGSNLGGYMGGIINSSTIDGVNSTGGWGALWFKPVNKVKLSA